MNVDIKKDPVPEIEPPKKKRSDWWVTENIRTTPERTAAVDQLIDMLTYKRVANSKTEKNFIKKFIRPIKGIKQDGYGNYFVKIGALPFLWSSHTDSVHEKKGIQRVGFDKEEIGIAAEDTTGSSCLGADDAAGVWLMLQMLDAGVPGLYIFHREEEGGRKGSKWIAEHRKDLLKQCLFAIALDRRGTDNLITHQMNMRCCSAEWAQSLAALLNATGLTYKLDDTGSYTDTASYTDEICECTNLSVGYHSAHSKWERLDLNHIFKLRDVLCSTDFVAGMALLEPHRKPGEKEYKTYNYSGRSFTGSGHGMSQDEMEYWEQWGYGCYNGNGYGTYDKSRDFTTRNSYNGHGSNSLPYDSKNGWGGTKSGTQVGHGVSKIGDIRSAITMGTEENPDGKGAVIILPPPAKEEIVGNAITPPDDEVDEGDHDTNYERLITLIKRNPEATLELLSQLIDESPETIADIFDAEGLTEKTLTDEILSMYGVVNC